MAILPSICIFVLGMHRTGTSVMTGLLTLAGASAGRDLLPPNKANPKGFFENVKVVELNDKILKLLDSAWDDMRPLPPDWWKAAQFAGCEQEIRDFLVSEFTGVLSVIKDPRLCKTLPLWLQATATLGIKPMFVLCARSPAAVVQSEKVMKGLPALQTLLLYLDYSLHAEIQTRGHTRVVVAYPDLLADWRIVIKRIATTLGLSMPVADPAFIAAADDFVSRDLNRSDKSETDELECWALYTMAVDVYRGLCELNIRRLHTLYARYLEFYQLLDPWVTLLDKAKSAVRQNPSLNFGDIIISRLKAELSWINPLSGKFDEDNRETVIYNCRGKQILQFKLSGPLSRNFRLSVSNQPITVLLRAVYLRSGEKLIWQSDKTSQVFIGNSDTVIDISNDSKGQMSHWLLMDKVNYLDLDLGSSVVGLSGEFILEIELNIQDKSTALQPILEKNKLLNKLYADLKLNKLDQTTTEKQVPGKIRLELLRAEAQLELLKDLVFTNNNGESLDL